MKGMLLQRISVACVLAGLAALSGCGAPIFTTDDVMMSPGQAAKFVISIDRQFGKGKVAGADVEFAVNGKRIGNATTDSRGMAILRSQVPEAAPMYTVRTHIDGEVVEGRGRIFQWDNNRTAVAVDVDDTISATHYGSLFLTELDTQSPPLDYSAAAVRSMSPHYGIVYLSARPRWLHEKTRVWLDAHGFPPGPILHAARFEACLKQEQYKRDMLAEFKGEFPNLLIGVGDKGVDERAYGANRMLTVILEEGSQDYQDHCIVLPDWRRIEEFFIQHRQTLCDAGRLRGIIHANNMQLRSFFNGPSDPMEHGVAAAGSPSPTSPPDNSQRATPVLRRHGEGLPATPARGDWTYGYQAP